MDRQIYGSEKPLVLRDFISSLRYDLLEIAEPKEKIDEKIDYHSLQSIIDILVSIPQNNEYKEILRLRDKLFSEFVTIYNTIFLK